MSTSDICILVVDDDPSIRMILRELFLDCGYRVDVAEMPAIAIQKLQELPVDIVFSDINMPGMTGIELLRHLRSSTHPSLPVVIMTADATLDSAIEATKLNAQDYLRKPFSSLADVKVVAARLASGVRAEREKAGVVQSLVDVARNAAKADPTAGGVDLSALAAKAERLLGVSVKPAEAGVKGPAPAQELVGDLTDFPLVEVLQLLGMMRKTGILRLSPPGQGRAVVAFGSGVVHASKFGRLLDAKALFRLFEVDSGIFHFQPSASPPTPRRIEQSTDWLIMEGVRQLDEVRALGAAKPPRELVIRYNGALEQPGAPAVHKLVTVVAARLAEPRTVGELLDEGREPDLVLYQALIILRRARALEVVLTQKR